MPDRGSQLDTVSQRGEPRGADEVLHRARAKIVTPALPPGRRRRIGAAIGVTCLALAVAVAAYSTISHRDNRATVATSAGSTSTPPAAPSHAGSTTTVLNKLLTGPDRSDPAAPFDPALQPYLVRVSDWPGSAVTTLAASEAARSPGPGSIIGQFSPCRYPFDDTSTASGHATTTLANPTTPADSSTCTRMLPRSA
jgi:hypothetical protein